MPRDERRRHPRIAGSATAYVTVGRRTIATLVTDLSLRGARLHGPVLPDPGAWISISLSLPPAEVLVAGHVVWRDRARAVVGVALSPGTPVHDQELAAAMLALEAERRGDARVAALLVDDPSIEAMLCETLRRHHYVPVAISSALEAVAWLNRDHQRVELAIVSPRWDGFACADVIAFLVDAYPEVARITLDGADSSEVARVDERLPPERPDLELDEVLRALD